EIARVGAVRKAWPECRFAVGVHPHHAHLFAADPAEAAALVQRRLDQVPMIRAIGEIGLDYHYDFSPRDVQHAVFRAQLQLARARDLPVVIHTREAEEDTLRILKEEGGTILNGVFHCFTGDADAAARALATGFCLSIPGVISFPKAEALRLAVAQVPAERLLVETDSPYLAPVPFRGKRNEPAHVAKVVERLAEARHVASEVVAGETDRNFDALFRP
ncbi:MAG: TatD family hydrolase, partial [Vicinamibacterales bacterium]